MGRDSIDDTYVVDGKHVDILSEPWDFLIILDTCRYDYFSMFYQDFFNEDGILKKAVSPAYATLQWLHTIFKDSYYEDIIYISANPLVNPRKNYLSESSFNGKKHFSKVVDVWKWGWDDDLNTVHPKELTKAAIAAADLHRKKRLIVHYIQPHIPYIYFAEQFKAKKAVLNQHQTARQIPGSSKKIRDRIGPLLEKMVGREFLWKLKAWMGADLAYIPSLWCTYGKEGIHKGYQEDLKLALCYVKVLITKFPRKNFLITADHAEQLGEEPGIYGHGEVGKNPTYLTTVPWFEIYPKKQQKNPK